MKHKILLTSLVVMGLTCPWGARAETFPTDGYMQENKTYESAATEENLGAYEGTVNATAEYDDILYQILAGSYLPAGSEGDVEPCPEGSYCPGVTDATYNETSAQGVTSCPTGYPNSEAGAGAQTQCYTACTKSSANIAHATAVSGNDYYGAGVDTCVATACENGYHVSDGVKLIERDPLIDVDVSVEGNNFGYISADGGGTQRVSENGLTENNTWAAEFDYGTVYGRASCQSTAHSEGMEYFDANMGGVLSGQMSVDEFRAGLEPIAGTAKTDVVVAEIEKFLTSAMGQEDVNDMMKVIHQLFDIAEGADYSTTDSGQHCYCQMTDYMPAGGDKSKVMSAPWVLKDSFDSAVDCASSCALNCGYILSAEGSTQHNYRGAMFGSLGATAAGTCDANEIEITWTDADPADVSANNAGMCTFGGDIRTPVRAATKPGKTFKGWKFDNAK